ncbi:MAG: hypothetical protein AB7O47_00730 [Flavobacteriales bacterium]
MINKTLVCTSFILLFGCTDAENQPIKKQEETKTTKPHNYGGWFCPDNLNGFPAVDLKNWKNVPVVNGRLPTEEEAKNGTSLIYVDINEHPTAKAMNMELPKLATFYNEYSKKNEVVIVIQAIEIENDSIVGFRYLNGGNGSAHFKEVTFITENEVDNISNAQFVSFNVNINASDDKVWEIMTDQKFTTTLQPIFDKKNTLDKDWKKTSNVNYYYANKNDMTGMYGEKLFGNFYIQNDYLINDVSYVEKFLLLKNEETKQTQLKIVCGPFNQDFEAQQAILNQWAEKIKALSEK